MDNSIEQAIRERARATIDLDSALEEIFKEQYGLNPVGDKKPDPGHMAWGLLAVDVSVRLANMFISLKHDKGMHRVMCDLTYQLNTNEFWQKNASVLLPLVHMCLNTHRDGLTLALEREVQGEYSTDDALIACSRAAPLEIFPIIAYLVGGPAMMVATSLPLKQALAPYILA